MEANTNIKLLNAGEFDREDLKKIFAENGSSLPNPTVSNMWLAEDSNKNFMGLLTLQPQYHLEPLYVKPEFRDTLVHKNLIQAAINCMKLTKGLTVYVFAPNEKILSLTNRFGFKELDYKVLVQEF